MTADMGGDLRDTGFLAPLDRITVVLRLLAPVSAAAPLRQLNETGTTVDIPQQVHGGLEHKLRLVEHHALWQRVQPFPKVLVAEHDGTVAQQFLGPGEAAVCQ